MFRSIKNVSWLAVLLMALAVAPSVQAHHCKGPHAGDDGCGDGGGGDGGGSGEFPATLTLRDHDFDRILSDGTTYDEGVRIRDDGLLLINITDPRFMTFDFSDEAAPPECSICKRNFTFLETSGVAASARVMQNDSDQELDGHLLGMAPGDVKRAKLKFGWSEGGASGTRWSVRFRFPMGEAIDTAIMEKTRYVQITRVDQANWILETYSEMSFGNRAMLISQFKQKGHQIQDEGTYHMPFLMTVYCPTCP